MANKKIKINVDLDFTSDRMSLEKIRDQIDTAIQAVEINLDPKSATKFKKDLEELGKYVERHLNKNTGKIDAKNLMNDLSSNSDLKTLRELGPELAAVGVHGTKTFNELTTQSNYLNRSLTESNSVLSKMGTTLMNTIRWNISASAVNAVTGEFQKMYYFAKDLDRTLTDIRIVSGQSADQMERFALHANESAKALRVSTVEYAQAATIFFQQGLGDADVKKMTDGAIMASRITGTAASDMADLLTSTMNGYKLAADEVMTVTDKLAAVGATTASNFQELATGMSKVASMANTAGVSVDELNAQLATIIAVTRESPESVGTSLKTIYGRMLMFKTDTKALMKDEDGEVFGAPKVEAALQAYSRVSGAQISLFKTTADGRRELRDLGEVIEEIGDSWDDVTDRTAKFGLATALAGSRQQNRLVALFDSWDMYKDAVETSLNAEGTALKQNAIYMESYEGRLKGLQAAKEEMYMVFTDSDSMKGFISGLTKAVEMFSKLADAAGGFNLVIAGIGVAFSQSVAKKGIDLYGSINKGLRGQNTSADKEELKMTEQLEKIKKVYGAEEANRLRDTLNTKKELLKVSATENDLIAEEHTLTSLIGKTVKENEGATQEGKIRNLMVHNEHLGISADRVRHIQEEYQLLKMAEQELADLRLRAAEGSATDNIDAAIEKAAQQVADLKMDVDHTMALIENRKFDSDKVVEFRESGEENANKELEKQVAQSEKVLQITDMIRTASMTIPVAIKLATDESTSLEGVLGGVAASTAPMLLSGLTKIAPEMIKAATGAASFGAGLKAALAVALPIVGPVLAIGVGVAAIALALKKINDSTVTFAKSMKELEKASEELEEQERAYEAIEKQLQEIRDRRKEIALINKEDSTTDEEKEKLQEELDLLDIKYGRLEQELTIEDMLLEVAKEKAEFAAKQAATATMSSDYSSSFDEYGYYTKDQVTVAEELEYATAAFVEADAQVTEYRETLVKLQADENATARQIKKAQKDYDKATETRDKATDNIEEHSSAIRNIIKDLENEEGTNQELIDSLEEYLSASTDTIAQTLGIGEAFDEASPEDFADGIYDTVDAMEKLVEAYGEAADAVETYRSFLDDLNDGEGLSIENRDKIIQKHQELIPYLDDEAAMRDFLIKKIEEEEEAQRQAYTNMIMVSEDFFNAKIKGNDTLVKTLGKFYTKDLENAKSLADAKRIVEESLVKDLSGKWAKYYNIASSNQLAEADYRKKLADDFGTAEEKAAMRAAINAIDQQKEVARRFDELAKGFASDVDFSGINLSSNKGSKSSSTKEQYKAEADPYARINQELDKNNVLLAKNKTLQDLAKEGSAEQLTLIQKENALYKKRQGLLNQLNEQRRAEALQLEKDLSKEGFAFEGSGDYRRITEKTLGNIQGKSKEVEDLVKYYNELQTNLIPKTSQQWWDYQVTIVQNIEKIESAIQSHIDELQKLEQELADFDLAGKIAELDKQLDAAKFNHWIESLILGLERYNDKTELLSFKLSLFDEEDYENRSDVIGDLFNASKDKLKAYREEWNKLSAQTPKNADEANKIANAMKQVQQGMRDAFVATRDYQRQLERLQFESISSEFAKANKQLELQLSIIDHNLQNLQDGILPDFSLDMVMPIPDFSDIFDETASENKKIYNEQADFEKQIQSLKKQSLEMQLAEAEDFYEEEKAKLIKHYKELVKQIADKEAEILELQQFADEQQKLQLQNTATEIQNIVSTDLNTLEGSYATSWDNIVNTVSNSVAEIKRLVSQANKATSSMGSAPSSSGGGSAGSYSGSTGSENLNPVVNVNPDGKAPPGLPVGTTVKTGGGDYQITKVNPDGSYESKKVPKYAKGTDGHQGGNSLVGEEGIELGLLPSGKVIILGKTGSQLVDLPAGTQVIPHDETKDILSHTGNIDGKTIPKYKDGTGEVIPKYASGVGIIGSIIGAISGTIASTISKVSGTSGKLKDTTDKLNKANNQIDKLNNRVDSLSGELESLGNTTQDVNNSFKEVDFSATMSDAFKEGSGKYAEGNYDSLGFEGYDKYLESRESSLKEIADLQKQYLEGTNQQISKEEILAKIDAQMLEDARTQSWLKVDLLEQMKDNVAEYTQSLKEQYDDSLASGNTELARQIFEEYNSMLTKQMQIENQIQSAIKERYDMEFALIDKKLAKEEQNKSFLDKELKYAQTEHPDNYERQQIIQEETLKIEEQKNTIQKESLESILKQRDALAVGSHEWNLLNDRADELKFSILDSNQAILDMQNSILDTNFNGLLSGLDEFSKKMDDLEYELQLKQILNPDDVDGISAIYDKMANVSSSQIDSLYAIANQLRDQQGLLDSTSSQWGVIGSQIDDVVAKIKAANLALAQQAKDSFGKYLGDLGDKVTSSNPEPSSPTQAEDDGDKWLDSREKELEIQKMMNYIEENGIKLTKEQLKLLNSKGKIRKSELNILQKELELQQLQVKLENLRNQKTIQQLTKSEDGTWDFTYVADEDAIRDTEEQMIDAELSAIDAKKSLEKELAQEAQDAMQNAYESAKEHYEAQMELLDKTLNEAENRMYKSAEEFRAALESIDLDLPIDEMVDEYWEYFLKTATIFINEALDITKLNLKSHLKEFEEAGNTAGQGYTQGLLDSIDEIMSGEGDIVQKQQTIIDMLASEYSEFALAGNKNGMSFISGLISSMETADYQYSANEMSGKIVQAMEERLKELEGTGQDAGKALIEGLLASMDDIANNGEIENKLLAILALLDKTNEYGTLGQALGEEFMQSMTDAIVDMSDEVSGEGEGVLSVALNSMIDMLDEKIGDFAEKGDIQGVAYAEALKLKLVEALTNAELTQEDIINLLAEFKDFDLAGLLSGEAYDESLTEGLADAEENAKDKSSAIVEGLNEDVENFADAGTAQGEAYKTAITTAFESAIATAKGLIGNLVEYINSQSFGVNVGVSGNVPQPESFDTGGGTGSWGSSGKLGILHQKETILNQSQSKDFNKLVTNMPDILKLLDTDSLSNVLKSAVLSTINVAIPKIPNIAMAGNSGSGDQIFHIAKMEFPNVKDGKDLQDAILNLPLKTKQYVKKN